MQSSESISYRHLPPGYSVWLRIDWSLHPEKASWWELQVQRGFLEWEVIKQTYLRRSDAYRGAWRHYYRGRKG